MFQKITFYMTVSLLLIMHLSCASWKKENSNHYTPHEHKFPFTKVMGDYHLRLEVNHVNEEMMLIFEDIAERPVKIVDLRQIEGEVIFPDGMVSNVTFHPQAPIMKKHITHREAGTYVEHDEWIGSAPAFKLHIKVPFEGKEYDFTYDYEVPGGKIETPYHRGY
jgi:hypothetical protein